MSINPFAKSTAKQGVANIRSAREGIATIVDAALAAERSLHTAERLHQEAVDAMRAFHL